MRNIISHFISNFQSYPNNATWFCHWSNVHKETKYIENTSIPVTNTDTKVANIHRYLPSKLLSFLSMVHRGVLSTCFTLRPPGLRCRTVVTLSKVKIVKLLSYTVQSKTRLKTAKALDTFKNCQLISEIIIKLDWHKWIIVSVLKRINFSFRCKKYNDRYENTRVTLSCIFLYVYDFWFLKFINYVTLFGQLNIYWQFVW